MSIHNNYYTPPPTAGKKKKKPKYAMDRVYASFWLDKGNDLFGRNLSTIGAGSSNLVKAIKFRSYNRAVSNFVKILTNKEIPVRFHDGGSSFTDGKSITLTTKIDAKNFDVVVGLALHEASHILLTDFKAIEANRLEQWGFDPDWKNLVNWIEDRRIDNYVFKTSPGYKAYYHKLYDEYFNNDKVSALLDAVDPKNYEVTMDNYMFHIMNMTNSSYNKHAMPYLDVITDMIDLPNIARLKSTYEVCELAGAIWLMIKDNAIAAAANRADSKIKQLNSEESNSAGKAIDDASEDDEVDVNDASDEAESRDLTDDEEALIRSILKKQRDFVDHNIAKAAADRSLNKQLTQLGDMNVELEPTFDGKFKTVVYNLTKDRRFWTLLADAKVNMQDVSYNHWPDGYAAALPYVFCYPSYIAKPQKVTMAAVNEGMQLGLQLGKKLRLVNESRELIHNRLKSGNIDKRRVACLGYDVETVFNQLHLDQYKGANLHISLDASGSMGGEKWQSAIRTTVAIAQAAASTQSKITVQASLRGTRDNIPEAVLFYDSKHNTIQNLIDGLLLCNLNCVTPEGLCYEALFKQNYFKASNSEVDSYLLNVSDGQPNMNSGRYYGENALEHTKQWINKIKANNVHILSYFVTSATSATLDNCSDGIAFKKMYGKDAQMVNSNALIQLAKTLNDKFLAAKREC